MVSIESKICAKDAFSLAELLLALTIVGIVASYTIPNLVQNVQDSTLKVAWKKTFSSLSQSTNKIILDNGGSLTGLFDAGCDSQMMHIKYRELFDFSVDCYDYPTANGKCWHSAGTFYTMAGTVQSWMAYPSAILNDSALIRFVVTDKNCATRCGWITADVNGFKGPNRIGKDIFMIHVKKDRIEPYGANNDGYQNTCTPTSTGYGCAALYLRQ